MAVDKGKTNKPPALPKGIKKEILFEAEEAGTALPQKADECEVHYVGRFEVDGDEFDSSRTRGKPLSFRVGVGQVIKAWDLAVATMHRGEISRFTCAPEFCYGERGAPPKIPGDATLIFEIELVSWRSEGDLFGDGGVIRTQIEEGSGFNEPGEGTEVLLSFKASAQGEGGRVLDERNNFEYKIGSGSLAPFSRAIDKALDDMKKGGSVLLECSKEYALGADSDVVVEIALTLHQIYLVADVSPLKNDTITKKQLCDGDGCSNPKDGGKVTLVVEAARDAQGEMLPGFAGRTELQFTAGDGEVCEALEHAVQHMVKEERAKVTCTTPSLCADSWLPLESLAGVEGSVSLSVELIDFDNGTASWEMDGEEKLAYALARKEVGTKHFKAQKYTLALERYRKVVEFLRSYVGGDNGPGAEVVKACLLNMAACQLKVEDHAGAKNACTQVLKEEPDNVKALFRRASAYMALYDYSEAEVDLRKLLEVDSDNKEAQRLLPHAVRGAKQQDKKASSMFRNMNKAFSGLADDEARRIKEKKEAKEAEIAKKSAEAKAEAKKWRETRGKTKSAEECKEDMMRASQQMADMQRKCMEMSMGIKRDEDD